MDDVYLLNNPFTFQAMEKHSAYCAMIRLGLKVPDDVDGPAQAAAAETRRVLLDARAHGGALQPRRSTSTRSREQIGYPLYMKPFDGGQWVGVTRIARRGRAAPRATTSRASG